MLWIDDLQWADADSLRLLAYLGRNIASLPVLVVGVLRPPAVTSGPTERPDVRDLLGTAARRLPLTGLAREEIATLWRALRSDTPDASALDALLARTAGNPFFLVHLLRQDDPFRALAGGEGIHAAARNLLEGLSPEHLEALRVAALAGAACNVAVLAAAIDRPPERVRMLLAEAERAGVLERSREGAGGYHFRHELIREVLDDAQPADVRARLHARIARALHAQCGDDPEAPWEALSAHYLAAARGGHEAEPAVACAERAAERATLCFAHGEAAAHLERALEALALVHPPQPERRGDLGLRLAMAQLHAGDAVRALATLDGVVPTVRALQRPELLARLALARESIGAALGGDSASDPISLALLREALAALPADRRVDGVRLRARLARRLFYARELAAARAAAEEALREARALGDERLELEACEGLFWALWEPQHLAERCEVLERHRTLAERLGASGDVVVSGLLRCSCLAEAGAIGALEAELARLRREADAAPWVPVATRWILEHARVLVLLLRGELDEAERSILGALAQSASPPRADARAVLTGQLGLLRHFQGRSGQAVPHTGAQAARMGRPWLALHAYAAAHTGRPGEARRLLEEMAAEGFELLRASVNWPALAAVAAEATALVGSGAAAAALRPLLEPLGDHHVFFRPLAAPYGSARRYVGLLDGAVGDLDAAVEHLEAAQALHERMSARPWLAITAVDLAAIRLRRGAAGDAGLAQQHLREAERLARALGMQGVLHRIGTLRVGRAAGARLH